MLMIDTDGIQIAEKMGTVQQPSLYSCPANIAYSGGIIYYIHKKHWCVSKTCNIVEVWDDFGKSGSLAFRFLCSEQTAKTI